MKSLSVAFGAKRTWLDLLLFDYGEIVLIRDGDKLSMPPLHPGNN
jgi:hypothetical protein